MGLISGMFATISAFVLGLYTSALTYTGGKVTFDASDNTVVDTWVDNALSNLWAGFLFVLPYLGVALWIMIVIGVIMLLVKKGWRS